MKALMSALWLVSSEIDTLFHGPLETAKKAGTGVAWLALSESLPVSRVTPFTGTAKAAT